MIVVDWGMGAHTNYLNAVRNRAPEVGGVAASLVKYLESRHAVDTGQVYIIGHSLGAHVAGFAGKRLNVNGGPKLGAIVGLDPANPYFAMATGEF